MLCLQAIESKLYILLDETEYPSISFAQIPIMIFRESTKFCRLGTFLSNLMWFRSYHRDHVTHPKMMPQMSRYFLFFIRPSHWTLKFRHRLCSAAERPHHLRISIQEPKAKLQVKRMWEFYSISSVQIGHVASWGLIIPFSTRKSPIFSFSWFASHTHSFALRGYNVAIQCWQ